MLLFSNFSIAQIDEEEESVSLIIENPKIPQIFTENEKNQSGKIILKACTKVKGYQIIIGEFDPVKKAKFQVHVVEVEVVQDAKSNFTMTAKLFDEKSKKLINKVSFENVEKISYFRELERLMNELFLPVDLEKEKESKKVQNLKKVSDARGAAPIAESETSNINFRERIMALKSGVDASVKDLAQVTEIKKDVDKGADGEGKSQETKPSVATQNDKIQEDLELEKLLPKHPGFQNAKAVQKFGLIYKDFSTNSKDGIIDLDTRIKYLGVAYNYQRPIKLGSDHFWHFNGEIGRVQSKTEQSFAPYLHGAGSFGHYFRRQAFFLRGGLDIDSYNFTNLPVIGGGLQACNVRMFNGLIGAQLAGHLLKKPILLGVDYTKPFYPLSDNAQVKNSKVEGQGVKATFMVYELFVKFHFKADYYLANYDFTASSTKLITKTQGFGINVNYVF